ncbi:MAG: hypothetical protein ABJO01_06710 [Parasphingorhabdus sp.]|uniref:hypothetical protein n=1 Tax=Parasphingorhabdus sp. TaxID=2709688 RepID=UPI0032981A8B
MIRDSDRYYGVVLNKIVDHFAGPTSIEKIPGRVPGFYLLRDNLPIYVKYSTSRRGPWSFTFHRSHQLAQQKMAAQYGECIVALVCGQDGVAAMDHSSFRMVLDNDFDEQEAVLVRRKLKQMYRVSGKDGVLESKVARNSLTKLMSLKK